jgi:hypothetical protein
VHVANRGDPYVSWCMGELAFPGLGQIDGFAERAPAGLHAAKVFALDHLGLDGLGPSIGQPRSREARGVSAGIRPCAPEHEKLGCRSSWRARESSALEQPHTIQHDTAPIYANVPKCASGVPMETGSLGR